MNNLHSTNHFRNLLFAFIAVVLMVSCKKSESIPDDPNIVHTVYNKTILSSSTNTATKDSIDVNLDTKYDFAVLSLHVASGDTAINYMLGEEAAVYVDSTQQIGGLIYGAQSLADNQKPERLGTQTRWSLYASIGSKFGANVYGVQGDKYIPIIVRNFSNNKFHYGWVHVNISSDFNTVKIIDAAYNVIPDEPIAMGAQ
jgi:hypothetical protein